MVIKTARAFGSAVGNMIIGGNLASLGLLRYPGKAMNYATQCRFLYGVCADKRGLPQKPVFEVLKNGNAAVETADITVAWDAPGQGEHWFHALAWYTVDIVQLCLLCRLLKPKHIFEIGTLRGYTSLHFALNSPPDALVYSLDMPKQQPADSSLPTTLIDDIHIRLHRDAHKYVFEGRPEAGKIRLLFGDSARFDYTPFATKIDLFFIDGAHSYAYVRSDTLNALKCCHPGSVIAWHDFGRFGVNGVSKWLKEFGRGREIYSVPGGSLAYMIVE